MNDEQINLNYEIYSNICFNIGHKIVTFTNSIDCSNMEHNAIFLVSFSTVVGNFPKLTNIHFLGNYSSVMNSKAELEHFKIVFLINFSHFTNSSHIAFYRRMEHFQNH